MAPPPLPPPGPPPPPAMPAFSGGSSSTQRDMLLQSIRQGAKLKKTVTIDKSGPFIAGKVQNGNIGNNESSRNISHSSGPSKQPSLNGGPPGLGNLFASGIPKLKPTGLGIGSTLNAGKEHSPGRCFSPETKNRGPPPQPPPACNKPQIPSSVSDSVLTSSSSISNRSQPGAPSLPNKAPIGGYGKPHLAPKPPGVKDPVSPSNQQYNSSDCFATNDQSNSQHEHGKPSPPPKKISLNGRTGVNRAQSMRVPKSPPVAAAPSPPFPSNHKQNLVKNQSSLHQSQDSLNTRNSNPSKTGTLPHNFQKMALFPPNIPPPPAPGQRTPTRPPVSRPPPPPSRPAPPPAPPPPPPPHRSSPAPPPPPPSSLSRPSPAVPCSGPPAPPVRNLSVRNGSLSCQTDVENKFGHLFHNVMEFPGPSPFRNLVKNYNTRATAIGKQPAPPPPVPSATMQMGTKMWINNASHC